jgi:hypothetical protein
MTASSRMPGTSLATPATGLSVRVVSAVVT